MGVDTRRRVAGKSRARRRSRQHAARAIRVFRRRGKPLRGDLAILDIEQRADEHDLAIEVLVEEFAIVFLGAGVKIGQRVGRNRIGATAEIERHRVGDLAWNPGARQRVGSGAKRARRELDRHRGYRLVIDDDVQRNPPHDVVGIVVDVQRADIGALSDRDGHRGAAAERNLHHRASEVRRPVEILAVAGDSGEDFLRDQQCAIEFLGIAQAKVAGGATAAG